MKSFKIEQLQSRELMAANILGDTLGGIPTDTGFTGGVRVATGDVNGDGTPDVITGADDTFLGGNGSDILIGDAGVNDTFLGGNGSDILIGDAGVNDTFLGGNGRDILIGDAGVDDTFLGGNGPDTLIQAESTSSRTFTERVANIAGNRSGSNASGTSNLQPGLSACYDRPASGVPTLVDQVLGGSETNWIF